MSTILLRHQQDHTHHTLSRASGIHQSCKNETRPKQAEQKRACSPVSRESG